MIKHLTKKEKELVLLRLKNLPLGQKFQYNHYKYWTPDGASVHSISADKEKAAMASDAGNNPGYCFSITVNGDGVTKMVNYQPETYSEIRSIRLQEEIGESTGNRHLQGFITLTKKMRRSGVIKLFPVPVHAELARSEKQLQLYSTKARTRVENGILIEYGTVLTRSDRKTVSHMAAKRGMQFEDAVKDLTENKVRKINALDEMAKGKKAIELVMDNPDNIDLNFHTTKELAAEAREMAKMDRMKEIAQKRKLRVWQRDLYKVILQEVANENDRVIHVIYDPIGNTGKSVLFKHINDMHYPRVVQLQSGKKDNMLYLLSKYNDVDVLLFDIPRKSTGYISYDVLENVKNGRFNAHKYDSKTIIWERSPVVVIATNMPLDWDNGFSPDRWRLYKINGPDQEYTIYDDINRIKEEFPFSKVVQENAIQIEGDLNGKDCEFAE